MTSMENLLLYYNKMDEKDSAKSILRLILSNLSNLKNMSIYRLAEACYTSPSTISRLVKSMGYTSYTEFRSSLSSFVKQYEAHSRFCGEHQVLEKGTIEIMSDSLASVRNSFLAEIQTETLDSIANAMHEADSIHIFGYGVMFMETMMQHDLILSGKPCDIILGDGAQLQRAAELSPSDFALFLCPAAIDNIVPQRAAVETAAATGAKICVVASSDRAAFLQHAHYVISCRGQHYMIDSFYLETIISTLTMHYRRKYIDPTFMN